MLGTEASRIPGNESPVRVALFSRWTGFFTGRAALLISRLRLWLSPLFRRFFRSSVQCTFSSSLVVDKFFSRVRLAARIPRTARRERGWFPPFPFLSSPRQPGPVSGPVGSSEVSPPRCLSGDEFAFTRIRVLCRRDVVTTRRHLCRKRKGTDHT